MTTEFKLRRKESEAMKEVRIHEKVVGGTAEDS